MGDLITTRMRRDTQGRKKGHYGAGLPRCPYTRDRPPHLDPPDVKYTCIFSVHETYV